MKPGIPSMSRWLRAAALALVTAAALPAPTAEAADFNGDAKADVLWRNTGTGAVLIWQMDGGNVLSNTIGWYAPNDWVVQRFGDFNGDGKDDILWRQTGTGRTSVWLMSNATTVLSYVDGWSVPTDWLVQGVGDFNGDGKDDILWRQAGTGLTSIWLMNGGQVLSYLDGYTVAAEWSIQGVGDFDGGGKADILWRNANTGALAIWLMDGGVRSNNVGGWYVPADWVLQTLGDFNGDRKQDMLWRQTSTGRTSMWLMNGGAVLAYVDGWSVALDWLVQVVGDFNGDSKDDILWRQTTTGLTGMWLMDGGTVLSYPNGRTMASDWVIQPAPAAPAAPTALAASPNSSSTVVLTWQDQSIDETTFRIERSANGSSGWIEVGTTGPNVTTFQDAGLASATTYYYRVRANNRGGNSAGSNTANATTTGVPPNAPTGASATAQSTSAITVSWQDASSDETGFRVQRSADGSTNWTLVATLGANVTSYQDTGLTAGTTYYYRVRAYNAAGNSGFSNTASATTLADTASITLAWDDNSTTESGFRVERSPNGTSSWTEIGTTNANVTTYQNTGLTRGATYYYRVRAYTATEFSAYSNTLQVNVP
jgi:hypothetical protein